jgi:hypothetical protein
VFTTGSKYFFGLALAALIAAAFYGGASAGHEVNLDTILGVLTLGYKGRVGDHVGYSALVGVFVASLFIGCVSVAFRDAEAEAVAEVVGSETPPPATAPQGASYWPIVAAFGVGSVVIGLVVGSPLVVLGLGVLAAVAFEWAVRNWADRASADPALNRSIRNRVMYPIEVPVLSALGIAVFVLAVSRVLLAVPKFGAYLLFGLVPALILGVAWLLSTRPRLNPNVLAALLLAGGLAVLAGGVVGAAVGPRDVEPHEEESDHGEGEGSVGQPDVPVVVERGP